mmetsp:Transcript_40439/g.79884  ORF Transcript_40439/g.79884 Transcript_40439/m.79884 type:complete len:246 (-) Transcript_40439:828-1565(-)
MMGGRMAEMIATAGIRGESDVGGSDLRGLRVQVKHADEAEQDIALVLHGLHLVHLLVERVYWREGSHDHRLVQIRHQLPAVVARVVQVFHDPSSHLRFVPVVPGPIRLVLHEPLPVLRVHLHELAEALVVRHHAGVEPAEIGKLAGCCLKDNACYLPVCVPCAPRQHHLLHALLASHPLNLHAQLQRKQRPLLPCDIVIVVERPRHLQFLALLGIAIFLRRRLRQEAQYGKVADEGERRNGAALP